MANHIRFWMTTAYLLASLSLAEFVVAGEPKKVFPSEDLEFRKKPIDYWSADSQDPIAQLNRRIEAEELKLEFSERFGYLMAVLKALEIPVSSQLLRYDTGGLHRFELKPRRPRAFYFNDAVVITWFPGIYALEIAAQDSQKGTLFYQLRNSPDVPQRFERSNVQSCLGCHHQQQDRIRVPGHLNDETHNLSVNLPVELRWSGRYVSGTNPMQKHRGKSTLDEDRQAGNGGYSFDVDRYPVNTSDAIAHLLFDHQMFGQNLLSRLSYEHQLNLRSRDEMMIVRYLLLIDEAPLDHPTSGKSAFAEWYQARGPKDADGRSLSDLDLITRLFRHRVSPLIKSPMVQNFPAGLKQSLFRRLNNVLTGKVELKGYSVPEAERQSTLSVLRATVADWPAE